MVFILTKENEMRKFLFGHNYSITHCTGSVLAALAIKDAYYFGGVFIVVLFGIICVIFKENNN
jgi:hypothetical protein